MIEMIYRYTADYGDYSSQEIVIVAETPGEALEKLKAYLEANGKTKLAESAKESDLDLEERDVFETYGVDG